eukprot:697000_1
MSTCDVEKIVSFHALQKARSTLEDFAKTYLYYHALEPLDFLRYMDVLIYVECIIYSIDEINEEQVQDTANDECKSEITKSYLDGITDSEFKKMREDNNAFKILICFLKEHNLYDEIIQNEIRDGLLYWKLESFLCNDNNWKLYGEMINEELIQKCIKLKSFDYRLMNLVLYKIRKAPLNEKHLLFLRTHELIIEIGDDLVDYEDDVVKGSFNIYRMYLKLYPQNIKMACLKLTQFISDTEKEYRIRQQQIEAPIRTLHELRNTTAWQGIVKSDDWIIPSPIVDETAYRNEVLQIEQSK